MTGTIELKVIVALRNEKGSYNVKLPLFLFRHIVALRNEKGSYNPLLSYH